MATLSYLQARGCRIRTSASQHVALSPRPKETPYFTLATYKVVAVGLLVSYLIPMSSGYAALGDAILRALWLAGFVLPLSVLSLFRRETGSALVIPVLVIAFSVWGVLAAGAGIGTLLQE